jgi:hypothetical protein
MHGCEAHRLVGTPTIAVIDVFGCFTIIHLGQPKTFFANPLPLPLRFLWFARDCALCIVYLC